MRSLLPPVVRVPVAFLAALVAMTVTGLALHGSAFQFWQPLTGIPSDRYRAFEEFVEEKGMPEVVFLGTSLTLRGMSADEVTRRMIEDFGPEVGTAYNLGSYASTIRLDRVVIRDLLMGDDPPKLLVIEVRRRAPQPQQRLQPRLPEVLRASARRRPAPDAGRGHHRKPRIHRPRPDPPGAVDAVPADRQEQAHQGHRQLPRLARRVVRPRTLVHGSGGVRSASEAVRRRSLVRPGRGAGSARTQGPGLQEARRATARRPPLFLRHRLGHGGRLGSHRAHGG